MATAIKSSTKTKTAHRRASRSPRRKVSPTRNHPELQFHSTECAYADPLDSSRTLLQNVLFDRKDREALTPQAEQLFNSLTVFEDEAERSWLQANMRSTTITIKVDDVFHTINGNYAWNEHQPCVLFLHGFGTLASWSNWIKLAYPLGQRGRYSVIFVDLPGFGQSSGRYLDQATWKRHGPEIILAILSSFHIQQPISVVAQCGGAATTVRALNRYPQWFRGRGLVFCNSVIGDFGEMKLGDFENNLTRFNIHIVFYWISDQDHTKHCIAYKRWNKLRQSGFRNLQLIDLDPSKQKLKLSYPAITVQNMSHSTPKHKAHIYKFSDDYVQQILDVVNGK